MPRPYAPDQPDKASVQLRLMDEQVTLSRFSSYSFESDFMSPSDGFSFTMEDEELPAEEAAALKVGARVSLTVNAVRVADGHIDRVTIGAKRSGGRTWNVRGRDRLGLAVDSTADPTLLLKAGATLADALQAVFAPYGWATPEHFVIDNDANRAVSTGGDRGVKMSKGGKKRGPKPLKSFVLHQTKPYNHEGAFDFAKRMASRFGLWIWCESDGERLVVGEPDFDQEPLYRLHRGLDGTGNIEDGEVSFDATNQPSIIIADGFSGGGEYGKGRLKAFCVNPYFGVDKDGFVLPDVEEIIKRLPSHKQVVMTTQPYVRRESARVPRRPMWLHDDESKTPEQLEAFIRREMSLMLRQSLTCDYTVEGHGQLDPDGIFTAWAVDTVVDVQDAVADVRERMYVLSVHFEQSRHGGTTTRLHLIRLHSIQF